MAQTRLNRRKKTIKVRPEPTVSSWRKAVVKQVKAVCRRSGYYNESASQISLLAEVAFSANFDTSGDQNFWERLFSLSNLRKEPWVYPLPKHTCGMDAKVRLEMYRTRCSIRRV